jgi:hypothetical protein
VLHLDGPGLDVDDHQLGWQAVLYEQDLVQTDWLAGVDFHSGGGVVAPDDLFLGRHLGEVLHPGEENVAVGKHPDVVVFVARSGGIGPDDGAVIDEEHFVAAFADVKHRMLGQSFAGQSGGNGIGRRLARGSCNLGGAERLHIRCGKTIQQGNQRRRLGWPAGGWHLDFGRVTAGQCGRPTND